MNVIGSSCKFEGRARKLKLNFNPFDAILPTQLSYDALAETALVKGYDGVLSK